MFCCLCNCYLGALTQVGVLQALTEFAYRYIIIIIIISNFDIILGFKWASNTEDEISSHIARKDFIIIYRTVQAFVSKGSSTYFSD